MQHIQTIWCHDVNVYNSFDTSLSAYLSYCKCSNTKPGWYLKKDFEFVLETLGNIIHSCNIQSYNVGSSTSMVQFVYVYMKFK